MYVDVIADYGSKSGINDLAFSEVLGRIYENTTALGLAAPFMAPLSVSPFNPVETGFVIAQLAFNSNRGNKHFVYHNTAPRKDDMEARPDNNGEELAVCQLPNGVYVIGVNSKNAFTFLSKETKVYGVKCSNEGTQFRSRDIYPKALASLMKFSETGKPLTDWELCGAEQNHEPLSSENIILYIDGYGNLKTSMTKLPSDAQVKLTIAGTQKIALIRDGIFSVKDGTLVLAYGSSGWNSNHFLEIVLRGGSAFEAFGRPHAGQRILLEEV